MHRTVILILALLATSAHRGRSDEPHLANGIKIGEVTQNSAIVWARLTVDLEGNPLSADRAAPGESGSISVSYESKVHENSSGWVGPYPVDAEHDFTVQIPLTDLRPGADYELTVYGHDEEGALTASLDGEFRTPPDQEAIAPVRGVIVTGQGIGTTDHPKKGHRVYDDFLRLRPDFFVHTGDVVYYDQDEGGLQPLSKNIAKAENSRMKRMEWKKK